MATLAVAARTSSGLLREIGDNLCDYLPDAVGIALGRAHCALSNPPKHNQVFLLVEEIEDAADVMGISPATAKRHWTYSKAWLFQAIRGADENIADS